MWTGISLPTTNIVRPIHPRSRRIEKNRDDLTEELVILKYSRELTGVRSWRKGTANE
jgi:hypothetical protein